MGAAALPIISGVGVLGGLIQGHKAQQTANKALNLQQGQANNQADLFRQTAPTYNDIIQSLRGISGLGGQNQATVAGQLPYTNVSQSQLGIYANPTDALRLRAAEDESRMGLNSALHNYSFGSGQRGLYGSSIDAAGRAALIGDALRGQNAFSRQLAIQAPQAAMDRLTGLAGLLNPGLGAGPTAAGIYGQGAQTAFGQQGLYGQQAGGALANWAQYQGLQSILNQHQPTQQQWGTGVTNQLADLSNAIP